MKVKLLVIFLALSLLHGVQAVGECIIDGDGDAASCGCELQDASNNSLLDISLHFDKKEVTHELRRYVYSPCFNNTKCGDINAAICDHIKDDPRPGKSIGSQDSVEYTVNSITPVNISATYFEANTTSVVYLVCGGDGDDGTFTFVEHDKDNDTYYFQLSDSNFCIPASSTLMSTTSTGTSSSTTMIPTMITTMTMSTVPATMTSVPTMTSPMSPSTMIPPSTMTGSMIPPSSITGSMNMSTTMTMTMVTSGITSTVNNATVTPSVTHTSPPQSHDNKDDEDRKVVLGVVLSIVGAIIIGVIVAIVVYFLWKKRKGASYEKIPTM